MSQDSSKANPLGQLADEFVKRLRNGEDPDVNEYEEKYPEQAEEIRELFPMLMMMEKAGSSVDSSAGSTTHHQHWSSVPMAVPQRIGGYNIIREIGRGGMGVVYEAEQLALGRHVALKVLPGQLHMNETGLKRFRQEARVAAALHHTNIVPVFEVGEENGTCFYAMQYIQGQSLDQVLEELRQLRDDTQQQSDPRQIQTAPAERTEALPMRKQVALSLLDGKMGELDLNDRVNSHRQPAAAAPLRSDSQNTSTTPKPLLPGEEERSPDGGSRAHYYRSVCHVGVQVAEALDHAHREGVLHRDIKPANLLLDTHSRVWITDFGLAKVDDSSLTEEGDIVGTLRYMAPERFHGRADGRSDIFSLGLTLYEMLLLRPAFSSTDRLALIRQLTREAASPLRGCDRNIPLDLETIVQKSIEKEPGRRYQTAGELAQDLQRFLKHEPVHARRIGPFEHAWRWCRRNPVVAGLTIGIVLVALIGFFGVLWQWRIAVGNERLAKGNEREANKQKSEVKKQRDRAEKQRDAAESAVAQLRRVSYNAHMNLAKHAWDVGGIEKVRDLLDQHRPVAGKTDLREFEWFMLNRLCAANVLSLAGHSHTVADATWRPGGNQIVSLQTGGLLHVWAADSAKRLKSFAPHKEKGAYLICFSPNGERLASASIDGTIKIWNANTYELASTLKGKKPALGMAISPDGKSLASVSGHPSRPGQLTVWNLQTGKPRFSLEGFTGGKYQIAFTPDGKRLAAVHRTQAIKIVDAQRGRELGSIQPKRFLIASLAINRDGKRLAIGGGNFSVQIWDIDTGRQLWSRRLFRHNRILVAFSPDGKKLAAGSNEFVVWDLDSKKPPRTFKHHAQILRTLEFSPDGKHIMSNAGEEIVRIWEDSTGTEPLTFFALTNNIKSIVFSPDDKRLAICGSNRLVHLWDARTGEMEQRFEGLFNLPTCVAFSPDGNNLACASMDRKVHLWNLAKKHFVSTLPHRFGVLSVAFHPQGNRLATADLSRRVHFWDRRRDVFAKTQTFKAHQGQINVVKFSGNGEFLGTAADDRTIKLWDANSGKLLRTLTGHAQNVKDIAFHPQSTHVASVSIDRTIKIWSTTDGSLVRTLRGHPASIWRIVYSPNGRRLATVGRNQTIKLWDVHTGEEVLTIRGPDYGIPAGVAFNSDGTRLATAWENGRVRIWDAPR